MNRYNNPPPRLNTYHGPKRQLLGNHAGRPSPAWAQKSYPLEESKILLSRLPADVVESEIEDLFKKTVGPLKDSFLIYNSQGRSRGMAIITFHRPGDALIAQAKYDGKIVDGKRPIKVEIISGHGAESEMPSTSLMSRLGIDPRFQTSTINSTTTHGASNQVVAQARPIQLAPQRTAPPPPRRLRLKRGPGRLKRLPLTRVDLDKDIEDYRAAVPVASDQ